MKLLLTIFLFSAVLSVILGYLTIPLLKKLKIGQTILSYVDKHKSKNGTPTMGGLFFILSGIFVFFIFAKTAKLHCVSYTLDPVYTCKDKGDEDR